MAKQKQEPKIVLEREYIVPLRKEWLKVPKHRRAKKAIRAIKEFMVRHMKVYDRDLRKVKLDSYLNNEIWYRGIKKPYNKIKVKAKKFDDNVVRVELIELPDKIKFEKKRQEKKIKELESEKVKKKPSQKTKEKEKEKDVKESEKEEGESSESKASESAAKEQTMKQAKKKARESKHTTNKKEVKNPKRKALKK